MMDGWLARLLASPFLRRSQVERDERGRVSRVSATLGPQNGRAGADRTGEAAPPTLPEPDAGERPRLADAARWLDGAVLHDAHALAGPSEGGPSSPCPGCGAVMPYASSRYPRRFCRSCLDTAVDAEGRSLEFADASMSGGLWWRRRGEASWHEETHDMVLCTVRGVPARVQEARLGGIAAEPIPADFAPPAVDGFGGPVRVADLRGPGRGAAVALGQRDPARPGR